MRTLIFGAKGQLGRDLLHVFGGAGEVLGCDLPEVDVADASSLEALVHDFAPDLLLNAAAYTDVDGAEDHLMEAFQANESGARNVAEAAAKRNVPVVYYSTDYVFDGTKNTPYLPDDALAPIGIYGASKASGEAATRKANAHHFILRTAWLYGPGGNNFVEKILRAADARPSLKVVNDEVGSPTHTLDLAEATLAAVRTTAYGTYHVVNAGECSRYEMAGALLRLAGRMTPITPCASSEFPSKAARPAYSVLDTTAFAEATGYAPRPWNEALAAYIERRES